MPEETFRWVVAGGVTLAAICFVGMVVSSILIYKIAARVERRVDSLVDGMQPVLETTRELARENGPKLTIIATKAVEIAANAKDISDVAKDQAHRFAEVGRDAADRAKAQIARVDAVVDETVLQVHNAGDNVKAAVLKPVKEAGAVLAGVRAAVTSLANGRRPTVDHIIQDEEMFI
jgi:methyl-accepting chemotaxis protein